MTTLAVRHTVQDFATWKAGFDGHDGARRDHGSTGYRVLHEGNNVLALIDFPDTASAQAFRSDPALREVMQKAGVVGAPDISTWTEDSEERY
ncbi:hypothetical protein [Nocardioides taihuensis]|uniref:Cyclase n=1 Tax=Nocardioides taihuensis TaxID=1835606 RepID=A0ABW0BEQ2_9ACTN